MCLLLAKMDPSHRGELTRCTQNLAAHWQTTITYPSITLGSSMGRRLVLTSFGLVLMLCFGVLRVTTCSFFFPTQPQVRPPFPPRARLHCACALHPSPSWVPGGAPRRWRRKRWSSVTNAQPLKPLLAGAASLPAARGGDGVKGDPQPPRRDQ